MENIKKILKSQKAVFALVIVIFLLGILTITLILKPKDGGPIDEDQIMIQKGASTVIINKNGLIEYRSQNSVIYQTWDQARITSFFNNMQIKAQNYISSGSNPCPNCYKVTMYLNGKLIEFYLEEDDELIMQITQDIQDDQESVNISDFFDDGQGDGEDQSENSQQPNVTISPSPVPTSSQSQESQDNEQPSPQNNYPPVEVDCTTWSSDITQKAIISNTFCTSQ